MRIRNHTTAWTAEVDWSNPLSRGLLSAWTFNGQAVDAVSGLSAILGSGVSWNASSWGTMLFTNGTPTGYQTFQNPSALACSSFSMATLGLILSYGTTNLNQDYACFLSIKSALSAHYICMRHTGKLAVSCSLLGSGSIGYDGNGAYALPFVTLFSIAATYDEVTGTLTGYVNGAVDNTVVIAPTPLNAAPITEAHWGTDTFDPTFRTLNGFLGPSFIWNRALSAAEVRQLALTNNPYAPFRPSRARPIYYDFSAAIAPTRRPRISMVA